MSNEEALRYMINLKSRFNPGKYKIEKTEWVDRLISDKNLNNVEADLVYELFDYSN